MAVPVPEERIKRFEKLGFGMFIHWGLYSQMGKGEWIMYMNKIPKEEYVKLFDTFTAKDFDARKIAKLAKKAGMKYITLTTRHHEGFSLYDTCGLCDYDAPHSPAKRDLIKEFVEACRENDILPMFYHTTLDWYQDSFNDNFDEYLEYLRKSVETLCTNYGEIGGFWFDGNWSKPKGTDWKEDELYGTIRRLQPNAMIINNTGLSAGGALGHPELDSVTFEQQHPKALDQDGFPKYIAAEMCQTINDHWGIGANDFAYKSLGEVIETLCLSRSAGANYLLNVGPDGDGNIPPFETAMLERLGAWVEINKESIYDGRPTSYECVGKDFCLNTENNTWAYVHGLTIGGDSNVTVDNGVGAGVREIKGIDREVSSIEWTDNGEKLQFTQDKDKKLLSIHMTPFPYGTNTVVRVAKISYK